MHLGSGKGAVSIQISSVLHCRCFGIDALNDFVEFSSKKAEEFYINNICTFETNDIRTRINTLDTYDIIILGAVGPIFGNYHNTLTKLTPHLKNDGIIIVNDAYAEEDCKIIYPNILQETDLIQQINDAGMELIDRITSDDISGVDEKYEMEYKNIQNRCMELAGKHPESKRLFLEYIERQKREYEILSNEIICAIFVIKKK
jgi:precorrin-6B methylase 2